jgi:hypothetical protein
MSRKFEHFEDPVALGELMMEYEIWDQNKHIGHLKWCANLKNAHFGPYECWTLSFPLDLALSSAVLPNLFYLFYLHHFVINNEQF